MNYRNLIGAGVLGLGLTLVVASPWTRAQNSNDTTAPTAPNAAGSTAAPRSRAR